MKLKALMAGTMALGMSGCVTVSPNDPNVRLITETQEAASRVCRFIPAASTIIAIFSKGIPELGGALAIAESICKAIQPTPGAARAPGDIAIQGVPVQGYYLDERVTVRAPRR